MRDQHINKVFFGDCRESMKGLIDKNVKVQMCVTSPPYWSLRDYGHLGQLGLEATPKEYIDNMVSVFRLVYDLLNDDGVLWLNLGDTYAKEPTTYNVKRKDLVGIPWLLAFALRDDGWYLRQDIIWQKPNPMPESVTDRCTKAHEYLFLLSKSQRYYFDSGAIKKPATGRDPGNISHKYAQDGIYATQKPQCRLADCGARLTRNRRSVWTIATKPFTGAHFATFPPALIEPCILAGSRPRDIVLDPFFGSGTTGEVAQRLGRNWIGCELNSEYAPLQQQRIRSAMIGANHA